MATPTSQKYRVFSEPRISANQLAEYTLASPTRRQAILRNAKFAPTFLVIRYGAAKRAICDFLSDDTRSRRALLASQVEQETLSKSAATPFAQNDAALSAEAIRYFSEMMEANFLPGITFTANTSQLPKLPIFGVEVSVNLDLVARNRAKGLVGGAMIQTSKAVASKGWREEHSKCVASMVWMLSNQHLSSLGEVDRKLCMSIDVFAKKTTAAPSNYKRTLANVEAACMEIATLWHSVSPPSDLDTEDA